MMGVQNIKDGSDYQGSDLAPPREPPHDDGMEARVAKLEEHVGKLREDVATIKERLSHTATKTWILGGVITVLLAFLLAVWWMVQQYLGPILQHLGK